MSSPLRQLRCHLPLAGEDCTNYRDTCVPGCSSSASSLRGLRIDGRSRARLHRPATSASPAATNDGVEVAPTPIASKRPGLYDGELTVELRVPTAKP